MGVASPAILGGSLRAQNVSVTWGAGQEFAFRFLARRLEGDIQIAPQLGSFFGALVGLTSVAAPR